MIAVHSLHKSYGEDAVLADVSVEFAARSLTSLIGPNGAGKTTLLSILSRSLKQDSGKVTLDGHDIATMARRDFAQRVATLKQSPRVSLRLTVRELVAFGRFPYSRGNLTADDDRIIDEALEFFSLEYLQSAYIDELSGGERQLAFMAMTVAQQTDYLLLDEPLNNLDIAHAVGIMRGLRHLCDEYGRTVILVIHDINFATSYSDYLVALKKGQIHAAGPVEHVITKASLQDLYGLDFEIVQTSSGPICNYYQP